MAANSNSLTSQVDSRKGGKACGIMATVEVLFNVCFSRQNIVSLGFYGGVKVHCYKEKRCAGFIIQDKMRS